MYWLTVAFPSPPPVAVQGHRAGQKWRCSILKWKVESLLLCTWLYQWWLHIAGCQRDWIALVIISPDLGLMFSWLQVILLISTLAVGPTISSGCWHCLCLSKHIRYSSLTSAIIFRQKVLGTLPANPHFGYWPNKALYGTAVIASFVWYWSAIRQNTSQHSTRAQVMQCSYCLHCSCSSSSHLGNSSPVFFFQSLLLIKVMNFKVLAS